MTQVKLIVPILLIMLGITSCGPPRSDDGRSGEFLRLQADQNRRLAELQTAWQHERKSLYEQRDALEAQRAELAAAKQREPLVAAAILRIGEAALCLMPILLAFVLLRSNPSVSDSDVVIETLLTTDVLPRLGEVLSRPEQPLSPTALEFSPDPPSSGTSA